MVQSFEDFQRQSAAEPTDDSAADSWFKRSQGLITGAAALGGALLFKRPIGAALERAGGTMLGAPIQQFASGVKGTFAPTSMGEGASATAGVKFTTPEATTAREAEALLRSAGGRAARAMDVGYANLAPHWPTVGMRPDIEKQQLVDYMERRSAGAQLADPALQPAADAMRAAYERVRSHLEAIKPTEEMEFREDYYRHLYKPKPGAVPGDFEGAIGKGFTKKRVFDTIAEARAKGYEPITEDPIEMTMRYINQAEKFIARKAILQEAVDKGLVKNIQVGFEKAIPAGWKPIAQRGLWTYYAPEGFARVWNNSMGRGLQGAAGDIYQPLQHTSNMLTALELGLSGFHFGVMTNEAIVSEAARAVQQAFKLDPKAFKTLIGAPLAPYKTFKTGKEVEKVWLGTVPGTAHMQRIVNLMERAGGRAKPYTTSAEYRYTGAGSFQEAWRRGARGMALIADRGDFGKGLGPTVKMLYNNVGRVFQSMAEPLFEKYIPRIKNGAFYETMSTWLEHNPGASIAEQEQAARVILDSIDNRFGEVVHDNIFWNKTLKQVSTLMLRSYSWNLGTVREIGGGVKDIAAGQLNSPRAAYVIALPVVFGMTNAVYQMLKTGKPPESEQDLIAPQTGGIDPATGLPERLAPVGYMKDVFGWYEDPIQEAKNKIAAGPSLVGAMATGRDWKGDPIAPPDAGVPEHVKEYAKYVMSVFTPISLKNEMERKRGTAISRAEQFMGLRPAGRAYVDPEGLRAIKEAKAQREWKRKVKSEARRESYYAGEE